MSKNKVVLLGTKGGPRMEKGLSWSTCSVIEVEGHPAGNDLPDGKLLREALTQYVIDTL